MIHRGRFIPTLDSKHSKGLINVAGERERERERESERERERERERGSLLQPLALSQLSIHHNAGNSFKTAQTLPKCNAVSWKRDKDMCIY